MNGYDCCARPDWVDDDVDGHCVCRSCGKTEVQAERELADAIFWQEVQREVADGHTVEVRTNRRGASPEIGRES